jgi:hypothetical protein
VRLGPPQVHAQDHLGPVLGFRSARTGLDVDVCVARIHLSREHASKLETGDTLLEAFEILLYPGDGVGILLFDCEREQFVRVIESVANLVETDNDLFELRAFLAKRLRTVRFVPDIGLLEFALNFGQPFRLAFIVKDTPSTLRCVR